MKNHKFRFLMPFLLIPLLFWGCTDLEETTFSVITPENYYKTEAELLAAVIPVYAQLRTYAWGENAHVKAHSSDALYAPTRGSDWWDGGNWQRLQEHTWTETDDKLNSAWLEAYKGVALANSTLDALYLSPLSESVLVRTFIAETRFLRAFYYWWLVDMFGNVPIVTLAATDPDDPPEQNTRKEVYDFIVSEIIAALPDLEESPSDYGRASKGAANALLATVYLNAEVYSGTAKWAECVAACDAVINSGQYKLMSTFDDVFAMENEGAANTEIIFVVAHQLGWTAGFLRQMATLHYAQLPSSPWNGFSVLADYYNKFDTTDARIDQLLVGQQYVLGGDAKGDSAFQRDGVPLVFTVEVKAGDFLLADESDGVRILKWPVDPDADGPAGNDFAIFRYSHVLLMKAEALVKSGGSGDAEVNLVRARAGLDALSSVTAEDIFDERGFELLWEGFRRQDQIRAGKFLDAWYLKPASDGAYRELFPIPQRQLDANPKLVQNTGY